MTASAITVALERARRNEPGAAEQLWELVYEDLKRLAAARLARLPPGQTLHGTALVHEVWMRLDGEGHGGWESRAHFFSAAARSMRNILVDQARRKQRLRRNAGRQPVHLEAELIVDVQQDSVDMLALDEALTALAKDHARPARVLDLRFFAGLAIEEIAELENVSERTIDRDFLFARTWLRRFLGAR